jgi:hypothetical protein
MAAIPPSNPPAPGSESLQRIEGGDRQDASQRVGHLPGRQQRDDAVPVSRRTGRRRAGAPAHARTLGRRCSHTDARRLREPQSSLLSTSKRSDGTTQVTYNGHPLYVADKKAGDANGENVDGFGPERYVLSPSGKKIEPQDTRAARQRGSIPIDRSRIAHSVTGRPVPCGLALAVASREQRPPRTEDGPAYPSRYGDLRASRNAGCRPEGRDQAHLSLDCVADSRR